MTPTTRRRIDAVIDQAERALRALGWHATDTQRRTVLRTLTDDVLRIQALDASEPEPRGPGKTPAPPPNDADNLWNDEPTRPLGKPRKE